MEPHRLSHLWPQWEKPDHFVCVTLFQIESEKSHIKLPGNIIHTIIVQPGTIGEYIVEFHFPSCQNDSSGCDNRLCEQGFACVCILKNLSQFVRCCGKYYPQGFPCSDHAVAEHRPLLLIRWIKNNVHCFIRVECLWWKAGCVVEALTCPWHFS